MGGIGEIMLELRVEVVPQGDESKRRLLEKLTFVNTDTDIENYGDYIVHHTGGSFMIEKHKRGDGYWPLIRRALKKYLY